MKVGTCLENFTETQHSSLKPMHMSLTWCQSFVKVWLMVGDTFHHLKDLPAERWSMVMPMECGIQDPSTLEPQRVTHAYLRNGRHLVIRDLWQHSSGVRNLEEPWSGSAIFALAAHVTVPQDGTQGISMPADDTCRMAFQSLVSTASSSSVSTRPSPSWAKHCQPTVEQPQSKWTAS